MPVSPALNELSKLTLFASDMAYGGTSIPDGTPLGQYHDTPAYDVPAPYSISSGFVVGKTIQDSSTGAKAVIFKNDATQELIVAFAGTDGLDSQDWVANTQHFGWNQWESIREQVFDYVNGYM
jgi:hypothetical protein